MGIGLTLQTLLKSFLKTDHFDNLPLMNSVYETLNVNHAAFTRLKSFVIRSLIRLLNVLGGTKIGTSVNSLKLAE